MAIYSSILAWEFPQIEESGGLLSMDCKRIRQDLASYPATVSVGGSDHGKE